MFGEANKHDPKETERDINATPLPIGPVSSRYTICLGSLCRQIPHSPQRLLLPLLSYRCGNLTSLYSFPSFSVGIINKINMVVCG